MSGSASENEMGMTPTLESDNVVSLADAHGRAQALENLKALARALARQAAAEDHAADLRSRNRVT